MAKSLLHSTVKDLHSLLQLTEDSSTDHFEAILRQNVANVFSLLELSRSSHHLDIYTSVYDTRLFVYYTQNAAPRADINNDNIYQYLKDEGSSHSDVSVFDQLLRILATSHDTTRLPRLRQSFSVVMTRFSDLVRFFLQLHADAESDLLDLLASCFVYEHSYFSRLNCELQQDNASDDGTQHLVLALDSFIRRTLPEPATESDSIFTFDENTSDAPLNFECLDERFSKLYQIFLQLALSKSLDSFYLDSLAYVKVMVKFFKASYGIDFLEHGSQEIQDLKLDHICDFYLGSEHSIGFVPSKFRILAKNIIKEMYETSRYYTTAETTGTQPVFDVAENDSEGEDPRNFLEDDLLDLISHLDDLVSVLADFGLGFNANFARTFQNYLHFVYEVFFDNAQPEDFNYVQRINETVAIIINYRSEETDVEGHLIREIIFSLLDMQSRLLTDRPDLTLLMKAAREDTKSEDALMRKILRDWNRKTLQAIQLNSIYTDKMKAKAETSLTKKCLSIWYNKTIRFEKVRLQAATYSDKKILANILSSYWLRKIIQITNASSRADIQSIKPFFKMWRTKCASSVEKQQHITNLSALHTKQQAWDIWVSKYQVLVDFNEKSRTLLQETQEKYDLQIMELAFGAFKRKLENNKFAHDSSLNKLELSLKFASLEGLEIKFRTQKHFKIWIHKFQNETALKEFSARSHYRHKQKVFQSWKRKLNLKSLSRKLELQANKALISSVLSLWKVITDDRVNADTFFAKNLLTRFMLEWKLKLREVQGRDKIAQHEQARRFKSWKVQVSLHRLHRDINGDLANRVIQEWRKKSIAIQRNSETALIVWESNLLKQQLGHWNSKLQMVLELASIADLNLQRKHFNKIARLHDGNRSHYQRAKEFLGDRIPLSSRILLAATIRKWSDSYLKKFDDHTEKAVVSFQERVRTPSTLSVFLKYWMTRKRLNEQKQKQLEYYYHYHLGTAAAKRSIFSHWADRSRQSWEANEKSLQFYLTLLTKRFMLTWYEKYVRKVDYLEDVGQQMIDLKDYLRLVEFLRKWNLRYIKNVKRNQQTREIFTEKWEKAHLRSIFEIWLHKTRGGSPVHDYTEVNSTFGSNYSPLAKKNPKNPSGSRMLDGQSYLSTPVKKQVTSPSTPFTRGKGPSPTRLQETNQRMKIDRMDAMITRYRLAKRGTKSDTLRPSTATRLSPPRRTNVPIPERPPAPMFNALSRNASPNATSSPSVSPGPIDHTNPTSISDNSILDTAKKLHRIRTLVVPPEDDMDTFQYSSTSRLKERLASQRTSLGQANVFGIM